MWDYIYFYSILNPYAGLRTYLWFHGWHDDPVRNVLNLCSDGCSILLNLMQSFKVMWMTCNISTDAYTWKYPLYPVYGWKLSSKYFATIIIYIGIYLYWVLHLFICSDVRGITNSTRVELCIQSTCVCLLEMF